jgi:regulatory protein
VIARLRQENLINDARYALDFTRTHAGSRKQGPHRIRRELRARGVADVNIETAVAQVFQEIDQAVVMRTLVERRMRAAAGPLDEKKKASLYRALLRAGFEADMIQRELRAIPAAAAGVPATDGENE